MKIKELRDILDNAIKNNPQSAEYSVVIPIEVKGEIIFGGSPFLSVKHTAMGFDWNHGKLFLVTDLPVEMPYKKYKMKLPEKKSEKNDKK